ncbi:penicillin-binding protein [Amylibacter kogurei]|uniref:Penicillin-binding protein 1A n=1 Tax=Paramylibacter kogurei TaxID=1889778 RepID=A0A2G5K5J0_9RHOB|nr:PBP1A family penicillin-binding protein [Amylibacter kogurei]PIB24796.1 penicillin-binding protein [Amylibacter kogurei]
MLRSIVSFFGVIFTVLTLGAILGVATIAAVFMAYGRDLPDHDSLAGYEPATISRVYAVDGRVMDEFASERRLFTPVEEMPDILKNAFISAEDKNFYNHKGYDPLGIVKAGIDAATGGTLRGASTITQQVTKNFLLTNDRSAERKIKELILSARIEGSLSKDRILELYLNEIFLGQNSYGVTAAAETYFGKTLEQLNLQEVAYLASLPKAPSNYHPVRQKERALNRRNFVLREMAENGYASEEDIKLARASDLETVQGGHMETARSSRPPRNYFTDEIRRQVTNSFGEDEFFTGGYAVRATMDTDMQREAERALRRGLEAYDRRNSPYFGAITTIDPALLDDETKWRDALDNAKAPRDIENWYPAVVLSVGEKTAQIGVEGFDYNEERDRLYYSVENKWAKNKINKDGDRFRMKNAADMFSAGDVVMVKSALNEDRSVKSWSLRQVPQIQGGFVAMDTNTGRVLAMQGGFSYQHSVFNRATQAQRQPGSVFKPFVYAAAMDSGYSPVTIVVDAPIKINTPQGLWTPKNASNKFYGPAPLRVGIEQSRNLMTIRLAQDVGMGVVGGYAERFGVYDRMSRVLSGALGAQESTLYKIVSSYAMFANGGERIHPTLIDRVQDRSGKTVFRHDGRVCADCGPGELADGQGVTLSSDKERVMDEVTAYRITSMMRGVVERGTARKTVNLGVPVAGKTGTTNDAKDVWFVGFTSNIVAGCYMGFDTPKTLGKGASGGGMCGPVFQQFMAKAVQKYGADNFEQPADTVFYKFDRFSGVRLPDDATGDHVVRELFRIGEEIDANSLLDFIDGGFEAETNIEIFSNFSRNTIAPKKDKVVRTSTGKKKKIPAKASFGSLSSGGLY